MNVNVSVYNRNKTMTYRQLLNLIHVWAFDNPGTKVEIIVYVDANRSVDIVWIQSTRQGNLSYDSRAALDGFYADPRCSARIEGVVFNDGN